MNPSTPLEELIEKEAKDRYPCHLDDDELDKSFLQGLRYAYKAGALSRERIIEDKDKEIAELKKEIADGLRMGEWQLCPKCNGQGTISKPPYVAGDVDRWSSTSMSYQCDMCLGEKKILKPQPNTK